MASLAGRPPFATDLPDSAYVQSQPQAQYKQPPRDDPNARTSAYNHYDTYLNGGNGRAEDRAQAMPAAPATTAQFIPQQMPVPLVAPKPGYVAPIAALNMSQLSSYDTARTPPGPNSAPMHHGQHGATMPPAVTRPRPPPVAPISVPSTPHPLPPTMTPILPVFARPSLPSEPDVNWGPEPIMRGNSEEKLIPRRGEKGDDFWRRFSMVAREESRKPSSQKQSAWLRETQSGATHMSIWVWIIGLIIFSCAGLGIGLGFYLSHKATPHQDPTTIGGNVGASLTSTISSSPVQGAHTGTVSDALLTPHVTPTNTVARRAAFPLVTPPSGAPIHLMHISSHDTKHGSAPSSQRRSLRRAIM